MIEVRWARSDADLEGWIRVKRAVLPNESAWTVEDFKTRDARGSRGISSPSSMDRSSAPGSAVGRTIPSAATSLRACTRMRAAAESGRRCSGPCLEFVESLGLDRVSGQAIDPGSKVFAERYGFAETDRQVEQVRRLDGEITLAPLPDESRW